MAKQRLSKLQKIILVTLYEKDKFDEKSPNKPHWWKKPPYWHMTRDMYAGQAEGKPFPTLIEKGVANMVLGASQHKSESFLPAFSRSIRNLHSKGLIDKPERLRGDRFDLLKLTNKALKLTSDTQKLTITP